MANAWLNTHRCSCFLFLLLLVLLFNTDMYSFLYLTISKDRVRVIYIIMYQKLVQQPCFTLDQVFTLLQVHLGFCSFFKLFAFSLSVKIVYVLLLLDIRTVAESRTLFHLRQGFHLALVHQDLFSSFTLLSSGICIQLDRFIQLGPVFGPGPSSFHLYHYSLGHQCCRNATFLPRFL